MSNPRATPIRVVLPLQEQTEADATRWRCPGCRSSLDLSQPSAQNPDMLLGTCPRCDGWYLFYQNVSNRQGLVLRLPDAGEVAQAATPSPVVTPEVSTPKRRRSGS